MADDTQNLRAWQKKALELYRIKNPRDFTVTATPGAGKTTFALTLASKLLEIGAIEQIVIVVPTDHLRTQWADAAIEKNIFVDPSLSNAHVSASSDFIGYVVTYAQVASAPNVHKRRISTKPTFVIFDEIHHAGDGLSWGDAILLSFEFAIRRLSLTGTPFRSAGSKIPFIKYEEIEAGVLESVSDYAYGYGDALNDNVVRPVTFAAYDAESEWISGEGDTFESNLMDAESQELERKALKAAFDPQGQWIPHVFRNAHERLIQLRTEGGMPDAGGMVLASDQESARAYAAIMRRISKHPVTIVISDDNTANKKIDSFRDDADALWIVAVRMVSEGVDIPRLAVGVWATNYRTPLFFAQAIGRYVRARHQLETATVFLPATRQLLALAATMEEQRRHVIEARSSLADEEEFGSTVEDDEEREEREANKDVTVGSDARFEHILYNGKAIDGLPRLITPEDIDYMGLLPGVLSPNQMAEILRARDAEMKIYNANNGATDSEEPKVNLHRQIRDARRDINRMVSRMALQKSIGHAYVHKLTQKAVPGPPSSVSTLDILEKRQTWLKDQLRK